MAQQSSVKWLEKEINARGTKENNPPKWLQKLYDKAKKMHKVDCLSFAEQWEIRCNEKDMDSKEQLYDEIYNK